jgi:RimJ/RimL family protein N-acetyltransferase
MRAIAAIEEPFMLRAYASERRQAWLVAHATMALPFQLWGRLQRSWSRIDGRTFRVVELGRPKRPAAVCDRLVGSRVTEGPAEAALLLSPRALELIEADLVVAEIHRWLAPRFRRAGWRIIPDAVRWEGDLAGVPPVRPCSSLADDLRKVRSHGYTLEPGATAADWEEFYSTMLIPQAMSRFGDEAWLPSRRFLGELARRGRLHFIVRAGERVGGMCSLIRDDTVWVPVTGLRQGRDDLRRDGAAAAALALTLDWARRQGCRRVDAGRTSPFLQEGVHRWKRKWGLQPVRDPMSHLLAAWIGSDPARAAFAREPVLIETADGLECYAGEP